jgi:hypothetical protein
VAVLRWQLVVLVPLVLSGCQSFQASEPAEPPVIAAPVCPPLPEPQACPEPTVIEVEKACPAPVVAPPPAVSATKKVKKAPRNLRVGAKQLLLIGGEEWVNLAPPNVKLKARIDTGAEISSLNAVDLIPFEREGKRWVRFSLKTNGDAITLERPLVRKTKFKTSGADQMVVELVIQLADIEEEIDVVLLENNSAQIPLLVGRNFLTDNAVVDVSKTYTVRD